MTDDEDDLFSPAPPPPPRPGPWFPAQHRGTCEHCGWIEPGDTIRATGTGGWEHDDCIDAEPGVGTA